MPISLNYAHGHVEDKMANVETLQREREKGKTSSLSLSPLRELLQETYFQALDITCVGFRAP